MEPEAMLDTILGPLPASVLELRETEQAVPAGKLLSTSYYYGGRLVKQDQRLVVSEVAFPLAGGGASL